MKFDKFAELKKVLQAAHQQAEARCTMSPEHDFEAMNLMQQIEYAVELLDADSLADEIDV
jgi:hypothetical protein